jgi:hypothetical protein
MKKLFIFSMLSLSVLAISNFCLAMERTVKLPDALIIKAHLYTAGLAEFDNTVRIAENLACRELSQAQLDREIDSHLWKYYYGNNISEDLFACMALTKYVLKRVMPTSDNM